ncbi:MAG: Clp protease N-terminal domain-containing protein [Acidobacteriaceae bacterium]
MFERCTEAARRVIFYARIEANHRDDAAISAEHLLLGLTWERTSNLAGFAPLNDLAVDLRARMGIPHMPSTAHPYLRDRTIPLDAVGKRAIAYAAKEANSDGQYWIDCDHLLRGLLRLPNKAADALTQSGITLPIVRKAAREYRLRIPQKPAPRGTWFRLVLSRHRTFWRRFGYVLFFLALMLLLNLLR